MSRCPLESQKSLSVSMQLKHKQQPCFAALVHLRRRPTENKRFTYRHFASEPAENGTRKFHSAFTLHFGRKSRHSPTRFDKIVYFLSLFIVPNGCDGAREPPGGAREPQQVPPPSPRLPRQLSNLSFMHWMRERDGGVKGESRARALKIWHHMPTWLSSRSPILNSCTAPTFLGREPLKWPVFEINFSFHMKQKSFFSRSVTVHNMVLKHLATVSCYYKLSKML